MLKAKRILWGQGLHLSPQLFQQQTLSIANAATDVLHGVQRHAWGLRRLEIDTDALRGGQIRADMLEAVFHDGTLFDAPGREPPPLSRDLNELPQAGAQTVLYVCLPNLNAYGGNSASPGAQPPRPARYRSAELPLSDLFTRALDVRATTLELDARLMVEQENRDGFDSVAIARLEKDATGQWRLDEDWLPPMVTASATPALPRIVRRLIDILMVKSEALSGLHRENAANVLGYGSGDVTSFWLLHTVNRNFARLNHLARAEPLHPEELYLTLAEFCGELMTFSNRYRLADLPPYRHEDLGATFFRLDEIVRELLDTVISARYALIPLTVPKPSFNIGRLEGPAENADYYLSVRGDMPAARIIEDVPLQFKIGSPDDVEKILHSALRGVSLVHMAQTPSALPVRVGNHYFAFEARGDIFENMRQARSICVYAPESFSTLQLELFAVFH
ncbi:MAG: type VI secretion system baseplate subunit TssK [Azoarcus sp.]|jgi:type VI secretion system protein ImpJ|nr:type VI secretion system baseplate subunit TssK [Azoarcus sp.]